MKKIVFLFLTLMGTTLFCNSLAKLESFESDFRQIITNDQNSKIIYKGKLYAKKDKNLALWIYTSPIDKKIYYSEGKVVIVEPELEQAIFAKLDKVPNILSLLKKAKKVSKDTYITTFNNTNYKITLKNKLIEKITYKDELQNRVTILFLNQKINKPISKERFVYKIPQEYDILNQK